MRNDHSEHTEITSLLEKGIHNPRTPLPEYTQGLSSDQIADRHRTHKRHSAPQGNEESRAIAIHPAVRGTFVFVTSVSGYGRGMVNMARFFMLWQFFQIMQGKQISTFKVPTSFTTVSLLMAPFLAVDWIVNGYNHSLELVHAYDKQKKELSHQRAYARIGNVLRNNIAVIPIALIGAVGHSFVVHRGIQELGSGFLDHSTGSTAFEVLSWIIPVFCATQYLLSEGQHIARALGRPLSFEDYSDGMDFKGMSRWQQIRFMLTTNAAAIFTALAWGALEFTESYLILRKDLQSRQVGLGNEIAFMVACFFGALGSLNNFIADGERFKCFMSHPFREPYREPVDDSDADESELSSSAEIIGLPSRKIPSASTLFCSRSSILLILWGLPSFISSAGLGVVSFTGMMQFANVFVQFHNQSKPMWAPWWMVLITSITAGVLPAAVFFITKGRYIPKEWRHSHTDIMSVINQEEDTDFYQDEREIPKNDGEVYPYRLEHFSLDALQFVSILSIKLIVEFSASLKIPFLSEIAVMYLTALVVALIPFGLEEISRINKPVKFENQRKSQVIVRRLAQCVAQLCIPLGIGLLSEWLLHNWVMSEPVSESSRLSFAHVTGTIITGVSAVLAKRGIDYSFAKSTLFSRCSSPRSNESINTVETAPDEEFNPVPIVMMCCCCSIFAGIVGAGVSSVVGFFGHQATLDSNDQTVSYGFLTGVGVTAGCFLLLCSALFVVHQCKATHHDPVDENELSIQFTF